MRRHYLDGLDPDLRESLLEQLRVLWTHASTAIEGNSLTLGETHQVLTEGLTISGKPLRDHNEVIGHARAIDLIYDYVRSDNPLNPENLFVLHRAVQTERVQDYYAPIGEWKRESNSATLVLDGKQVINDTYAFPKDVPALMAEWLESLNEARKNRENARDALRDYARLHAGFVRIHPFADGNGRLARLLANIPVLMGANPPIIIPREMRREYICALGEWQLSIGRARVGEPLVPDNETYTAFVRLCESAWGETRALVDRTHALQAARESELGSNS